MHLYLITDLSRCVTCVYSQTSCPYKTPVLLAEHNGEVMGARSRFE